MTLTTIIDDKRTMSLNSERKIGDTVVSPVGFGAMGIGIATYGAVEPDEERFKVFTIMLTVAIAFSFNF